MNGIEAATRWITVDEFYADPAYRHQYYLLDGEPIKDMGSAHFLHELTKMALGEALFQWKLLLDPQLRVAIAQESPYQFNAHTLLIPDISIQIPRRELSDSPTYPQGSPEVVIEILSPSNSRRELTGNARVYWAGGAREVWALDPKKQKIYSISRSGEWLEQERLVIQGVPVEFAWPESK